VLFVSSSGNGSLWQARQGRDFVVSIPLPPSRNHQLQSREWRAEGRGGGGCAESADADQWRDIRLLLRGRTA